MIRRWMGRAGVLGAILWVGASLGWATEKAATPLPTPGAERSFAVLCYHRFLDPLKEGEKSPSEYELPVDEFEWQMGYLKKEGIVPVSLSQLEAFWEGKGDLPEKAVLLAFDDGFESVYTKAYPLLKRHGYPGVIFLYTDFIGWRAAREKAGKKAPNGELALTLTQIGKMQDLLAVESHTKGHLNLAKEAGRKSKEGYLLLLDKELKEPLEKLKDWFGKDATWLAYPFGVYNAEVLQKAGELGYKFCLTVNPGPNDKTLDPLRLKRNLILYPVKRAAFKAIFTTKVLHLTGSAPVDGGVVASTKPEIWAVIQDDVDPKSLGWTLGDQVLKAEYDKATGTVSHKLTAPLKKGGHMLTLKAVDKKGQKREVTWYFRVEPKK